MNQFQTLKSDLTQSRIVDINSTVIDDDEIIVKIESYAFTANNVTYGVAGDTIGYWKFFHNLFSLLACRSQKILSQQILQVKSLLN